MNTEIIVALISLLGVIVTAVITAYASSKSASKSAALVAVEKIKEHDVEQDKKMLEANLVHEKNMLELQKNVQQNMLEMQAGIEQKIALLDCKLDTLTDRVDKHNKVVERTYQLESNMSLVQEKIAVCNHRIEDLEKASNI